MRLRVKQPTFVRLELQPGDEIIVQRRSPSIDNLLSSARLDGEKFVEVLDGEDDEYAVMPATGDTAVIGRGRRRDQRSTSIPV